MCHKRKFKPVICHISGCISGSGNSLRTKNMFSMINLIVSEYNPKVLGEVHFENV